MFRQPIIIVVAIVMTSVEKFFKRLMEKLTNKKCSLFYPKNQKLNRGKSFSTLSYIQ